MKPNISTIGIQMRRRSFLFYGLIMISASFLYAGCEQPPVSTAAKPITAGGIQYTIKPTQFRILEVDTSNGTAKYAKPVFIIPVEMKNVGQDPFVYNPEHSAQQMTESTSALLYFAPKEADAKMPPEQKTIVNGVYLEEGSFPHQLESRTTIARGATITDYFLFEQPSQSKANLVFSMPRTTNRGEFPVLFKMAYSPTDPEGPKRFKEGVTVKLGDASFTVTSHKVAYIKTTDSAKGKGYTAQPLLKINYTIKNNGTGPISYTPDHRNVGGVGPGLFGPTKSYERARLQPTVQADGQVAQPQSLDPGGEVNDFLLYVAPTHAQQLKLEFPGSLIGQTGTARVVFDVDGKIPKKPTEMVTGKSSAAQPAEEKENK